MTIVRFTISAPEDLNEWLIRQAAKHNRSKTQEIINILKLAKARADAVGSLQDEKWLAMKGE